MGKGNYCDLYLLLNSEIKREIESNDKFSEIRASGTNKNREDI
jgi:hypothetical protein